MIHHISYIIYDTFVLYHTRYHIKIILAMSLSYQSYWFLSYIYTRFFNKHLSWIKIILHRMLYCLNFFLALNKYYVTLHCNCIKLFYTRYNTLICVVWYSTYIIWCDIRRHEVLVYHITLYLDQCFISVKWAPMRLLLNLQGVVFSSRGCWSIIYDRLTWCRCLVVYVDTCLEG